ncbi:MAG: DUF2023 family protein [Candidatus Gastranaerophilales bacterium]|nr:DUF2023 family protein [Candidatus Gastranaerophilales bacterium]
MELFNNLIYEYKKGMRDLAMYTCSRDDYPTYAEQLLKNNVEYIIKEIEKEKINIFFGKIECLVILKQFSNDKLNKISKYEDFILGIMLGYSRNEQYKRLLGPSPDFYSNTCST